MCGNDRSIHNTSDGTASSHPGGVGRRRYVEPSRPKRHPSSEGSVLGVDWESMDTNGTQMAMSPTATTFGPGTVRFAIGNTTKFAVVFVVVGMHTLSNLSLPLYLIFYVPTVAVVALQYVFGARDRRSVVASRLFTAWIFIGVCGFAVSLAIISPGGAVQGLVRFLFAAPLFMALVLYTKTAEELRRHLVTAVIFLTVASLTIPLQLLTGPISWFSAASYRDGLQRYSSLLGSLTSLGIVVGSYIVLSQAARPAWRWVWLFLIVVAAALSLQKAAFVNIAIGLAFFVILNRRAWKRLLIALVTVSALLAVAYAVVPAIRDRISVSLLSFGIGGGVGVVHGDVSIWVSTWDRLTTLPKANFEALVGLHSPLAFLTGAGFGMGNTALVPAKDSIAPMAHNQFAELFTVFGAIGGGAQIFILIVIWLLLWQRTRLGAPAIVTAIFFAYILLLLNSLFANGTLYQPASAAIFFFAFFTATTRLFDDPVNLGFGASPTAQKRWMLNVRSIAGLPRIPGIAAFGPQGQGVDGP